MENAFRSVFVVSSGGFRHTGMDVEKENPVHMENVNVHVPGRCTKRAALGDRSNFANKVHKTKFQTVQHLKASDSVYTRPLQMIPGLPFVADKVWELTGHCGRQLKLMASKVTERTARWGERFTYVDTLQRDRRANTAERLMLDRKVWRASILESRRTEAAKPPTKTTVEDIDAGDSEMLHLCSEYVKDIYAYLMDLEVKQAVRPRYLEGSKITADMRAVLIDWLIQAHSSFQLHQETLYLTVAILDRFLQVRPIQPNKLQLIGVAAMLLASKYEEGHIDAHGIQELADITDNTFTTSQIRQAERVVLRGLNFDLGRPLAVHFLRRASKAANASVERHMLAKYLMELTLLDYAMVHYRPSEVAAASLCLSKRLLGGLPWTPTDQHYTTYDEAHLKPIMQHIAKNVVVSEGNTHFQAVKMKYWSKLDITRLSESSTVKRLAAPLLGNP